MNHSKALRAVISVVILAGAVSTESLAQTRLGTYTVTGSSPGTFGGTGGGGGGYGGTQTDVLPDTNNYDVAKCAALVTEASQNQCDLSSVPILTPNGCGNNDFDVPDYLLARPSLGDIFRPACNDHDVCYGTFGTSKDSCDLVLGNKMRNTCSNLWLGGITDMPLAACDEQASLYSGALQSPLVSKFISGPTFEQAQKEGHCRAIADKYVDTGCP